MANTNHNDNKPTTPVVVACLVTLVALTAVDAFSPAFAVDKFVYAIIAGILFGVGGLRDLIGAGRKDDK